MEVGLSLHIYVLSELCLQWQDNAMDEKEI